MERKITVVRSNGGDDDEGKTSTDSNESSTTVSATQISAQLEHTSQAAATSETQLDIIAPAGKLGVILDSPPDGGAAYVSQVKDDSPIRTEIHLGDKILAVDDDDVSERKAINVSSKFDLDLLLLAFLHLYGPGRLMESHT